MHDPMMLAFSIRQPWPRRSARHGSGPEGWSFPFLRTRRHEFYWPGMIDVWHVDPSGYDSGVICSYDGRWRWHVHHWRIRVLPLMHLRRRLLTRCEWCGGRSRKGDYVNVSHQWDRQKEPWWRGERGLFHMDCSSIQAAHRTCVCGPDEGLWSNGQWPKLWGDCSTCGGFRPYPLDHDPAWEVKARTTAILRTIPKGGRDATKTEQVAAMWKAYREQEHAA